MHIKEVLTGLGLRATPHRLTLVGTLATADTPKSAEEIRRRMDCADLVTVYRNLQALVKAGLVREVRFKDTTVRYELSDGQSHHHHLVCTSCGLIDELEECGADSLEKNVLKGSKRFASIEEHSLEFFGTCRQCAKSRV